MVLPLIFRGKAWEKLFQSRKSDVMVYDQCDFRQFLDIALPHFDPELPVHQNLERKFGAPYYAIDV